ncbi:MAG: hypothetical protein HC898_07265, partial [Phycisphaerales bacterium]|nr:hypothetical protein [Phycisphaerales bacterium]
MPIQLRPSLSHDIPAILQLAIEAFGPRQGHEIARLIDDLLKDPTALPLLSLVATGGATVLIVKRFQDCSSK